MSKDVYTISVEASITLEVSADLFEEYEGDVEAIASELEGVEVDAGHQRAWLAFVDADKATLI